MPAAALEAEEERAFLLAEREAYTEYLLSLALPNGAITLYRPDGRTVFLVRAGDS